MNERLLEFPKSGSFFLFGPRQTGKTTLVSSKYSEGLWSINLFDEDLYRRYSSDPGLFARQVGDLAARSAATTVFIDEVQRLPDLLNDVQVLMGAHPRIRFVLAGSSARKLKRKGVNLLAGRAMERNLHPYVHAEIAGSFALDDVLRYGTLPGVYGLSEEEKRDRLAAYVNTYLREEIRQEALVRNYGAFSRFLDIAASQNGELVSYSDMARECGVSSQTVKSHYDILEDTLMAFPLHPWAKSTRKRLVAHPRYYFFDLGVVNAINRRLTADLDPRSRGRLFESFFVLEVHRHLQYARSEGSVYFWRTHAGAEVDILLEKHGTVRVACEIKTSLTVTRASLQGLLSFREEHPDVLCIVACSTNAPYAIDGISILPWQMALEEIRSRM